MRRLLVMVAAAVTMATAGHCQSKPPAPGSGTPQGTDPLAEAKHQALEAQRAKAALTGQPVETKPLVRPTASSPTAITIAPADRNLSPEELRKKYKERLGAAYVDYSSSCEPAVIAPGASGTLAVMMLLKQDAILPPTGPSQVDLQPFQGKLALGTPQLQPAKPAKLAPALRGKVAFDDFAILDIPVTVAADATPGVHPVKLDFTYELYNGKTGGWIERFLDHVEVTVQVGRAPVTAANAPGGDAAQQAPPANGAALDAQVANAGDAARGTGDASSGIAESESSSMLWIAVAGGVVLAVLLLLRRRAAA